MYHSEWLDKKAKLKFEYKSMKICSSNYFYANLILQNFFITMNWHNVHFDLCLQEHNCTDLLRKSLQKL